MVLYSIVSFFSSCNIYVSYPVFCHMFIVRLVIMLNFISNFEERDSLKIFHNTVSHVVKRRSLLIKGIITAFLNFREIA